SCTGGWISKVVTDIAGSSEWFDCGMAVYSYEAKQAMLGVHPNTLEVHGAVSRETAIEMVSGALVHSGATVAVAVTGIAALGGASPESLLGTVAIAGKGRGDYARAELCQCAGHRGEGRGQTVAAARAGVGRVLE